MKKRDIIIAILAITTASSIGYGMKGNERANKLVEKANELTEVIESQNINIEELTKNISDLSQANQENQEIIDSLKTELENRLEELEEARQRIAKINSKVSFNHLNVLEVSGATDVHMRRALKGTVLESVASSFARAEEDYGVNAFLIAARAAQESGWGASARARYQNNLTGYAVYNSNAKGSAFSSWDESIMSTAELLRKEYLTPGGHSFNGYRVADINERYCFKEDGVTVDYDWCRNIISIAYDLKNKANNF